MSNGIGAGRSADLERFLTVRPRTPNASPRKSTAAALGFSRLIEEADDFGLVSLATALVDDPFFRAMTSLPLTLVR
jgi:hypothetical protein